MDNILKNYKILADNLSNLSTDNLNNYDLNKTALFIVDMNNGFAKEGALSSPRVEKIILPITKFAHQISNKIFSIVAFTDTHDEDSIELKSYPSHCLRGDIESQLVEELMSIKNLEILEKNSTNGFFVLDLDRYNNIDNYIVVGCCTDICVYQFVLTLKTYFNQNNLDKNIIVPMNLVETYDLDNIHNADISNTVFLNSMIQNGVKVVKEIIV